MPNDAHKYVRGWLNVHGTKKKKKKTNNIRRASAAGILESFYRDGAIGASLHLQEPPLKGHLWELLWSLLHRRYLGPEKPLGRASGVLGADWLKSERPEPPLLFPYFASKVMTLPRSPTRTCIFVLGVVLLTRCQSKSPKSILSH